MTDITSDQTDHLSPVRHRRFLPARQLRARPRGAHRVRPAGQGRAPGRARRAVPAQRPEPAPRRPGHWFTGDGMIHGVRIEDGRAEWYRNRWVRTDSSDETSRSTTPTAPATCGRRVANTHIVNHAGKTLALVESSLPYEITNDLETVGAYDFGGKLLDSMTAHPKICPTTGEMHFFGYGKSSPRRDLPPRGRRRPARDQPADRRQGADDDARLRVDREPRRVHGPAHRVRPRLAMSGTGDCPTAGTTTTAPGWACCAATTRTARCGGSRSTPVTCSTSPTPTTRQFKER